MAERTMNAWFAAYGESHQHPTNKAIHWVCVPVIYFCVIGLLWSIPMPDAPPFSKPHIVAKLAVGLVGVFFLQLSFSIMIGMMVWSLICLLICQMLGSYLPWPLWALCVLLFIAAWIGQFLGHRIEGRKPSFVDDLKFLLIGPAWLLSFVYRRLGIPY